MSNDEFGDDMTSFSLLCSPLRLSADEKDHFLLMLRRAGVSRAEPSLSVKDTGVGTSGDSLCA